nr:MAG TPA: hypothetical protein [Caudoviricetes sp.]
MLIYLVINVRPYAYESIGVASSVISEYHYQAKK